LTDLTSGSSSSYQGAIFQLEQLKGLKLDTIKGVEVPIPNGRADVVLKDGTIIEYKSLNWSDYSEFIQKREISDILRQVEHYKNYQATQGLNAPIKIVFKGEVPEVIRKTLESVGVIVEVR
jgi:hypothetical protein